MHAYKYCGTKLYIFKHLNKHAFMNFTVGLQVSLFENFKLKYHSVDESCQRLRQEDLVLFNCCRLLQQYGQISQEGSFTSCG